MFISSKLVNYSTSLENSHLTYIVIINNVTFLGSYSQNSSITPSRHNLNTTKIV